MSIFHPVASSTADGSDLTLCKILENVSGVQPSWDRIDLSDYDGNGNPGTVVYTVGTNTVTLTLTWSGTNLSSVVRS